MNKQNLDTTKYIINYEAEIFYLKSNHAVKLFKKTKIVRFYIDTAKT